MANGIASTRLVGEMGRAGMLSFFGAAGRNSKRAWSSSICGAGSGWWKPRLICGPEQALLAAAIPMAQDVTAEADSGGHTDNRPLVTLLPTLLALRDRIRPYRLGKPGLHRVGRQGLTAGASSLMPRARHPRRLIPA